MEFCVTKDTIEDMIVIEQSGLIKKTILILKQKNNWNNKKLVKMFEIQIKLPTCVNLLFADLFISKKNDTWTQGQQGGDKTANVLRLGAF